MYPAIDRSKAVIINPECLRSETVYEDALRYPLYIIAGSARRNSSTSNLTHVNEEQNVPSPLKSEVKWKRLR